MFRQLRLDSNDACLIDSDYYSPTIRRIGEDSFLSVEEEEHTYFPNNTNKRPDLEPNKYIKLIDAVFEYIIEEGFIVIDGLGKHSESTEHLVSISENSFVVCSFNFEPEKTSIDCNYMEGVKPLHPFDFYKDRFSNIIFIKTHYQDLQISYLCITKKICELFDLDRDVIEKGNIDKIPIETRTVIESISKYIIDQW